jgi:Flp pilus assembly pilin Flp
MSWILVVRMIAAGVALICLVGVALIAQEAFRRPRWRDEDGVVAVEMALLLPLVVLLIVGGIDLGYAMSDRVLASHAASEICRKVAVGEDPAGLLPTGDGWTYSPWAGDYPSGLIGVEVTRTRAAWIPVGSTERVVAVRAVCAEGGDAMP